MKRKKWLALLLLAALCFQLAACSTARVDDTPEPGGKDTEQPSAQNSEDDIQPGTSEPEKPSGNPGIALTGNGEAREPDATFAAASAAFAATLLKNAAKGENTVISPYSVQIALAMTANGASGDTLAQMEQALGLPVQQLNAYLLACGKKNAEEFAAANALWLREGFPVSEDFLRTDRDYYGAEINSAPFNAATRNAINDWVNDQTKGRIKKILDEMDPDAVMYLVNALAFSATWQKEYIATDVKKEPFHAASGDIQAKLMYSDEYWYLRDENTVGFLKNYENDRFCYAVLMPQEGTSLDDYVDSLTGEKLTALMANASQEKIHAVMPKFTTEYSTELGAVLQTIGMTDAFDKYKADFSAMSPKAKENFLRIGRVLHKTFLQVNETGTEAAAATAVEMITESTAIPQECKTVRVDRPFVCGIYDREMQCFLFLGAIYTV